jgi:NAD(P)-dependent dehydrogenase (short-subunit alcohol dehydrogenase family)
MSAETTRDYLTTLFDVRGRIAVVVGGTSGLGEASAVALARCGAHVVVGGRDMGRAAGVVAGIAAHGGSAEAAHIDVLDEASVEALATQVMADHGRVDILVNASGVWAVHDALTICLDEWRRIIDTNLTGTWLCCRAFGRHMVAAGYGRIINFASTDGVVGVSGQAPYCASKGGVVLLTRTLGAEWVKHGVTVNAIGPTDFATPMIADALDDPSYRDWIMEAIPKGRVGQPEEIASTVLYLASAGADMVVGSLAMVDGGRTII